MSASRKAQILGAGLIVAVWVVAGMVFLAVFAEYGGGLALYRRIRNGGAESVGSALYDSLKAAYDPFAVQHLHPWYLFSLPTTAAERSAISNYVVHLTPDGFRGVGPRNCGGRRLGFLIGGSTAFGHFASSDRSTIAAYLTAKQDTYCFVNAGVPAWNSQQELHRVVDELLAYHPSAIVALDGWNDAVLALEYTRAGRDYPPGVTGELRHSSRSY